MINIGFALPSKGNIPGNAGNGRAMEGHVSALNRNFLLQFVHQGSKYLFYAEKKRIGFPEYQLNERQKYYVYENQLNARDQAGK
jgi:hypothetical protein